MKQRPWFLGQFLLIIVLLTISHHTAPVDGYWDSQDFRTSQGSLIRIGTDVGSLEWIVGRTYEASITIIVRGFGSNVDRFYDVWLECKWGPSSEEATNAPKGPLELVTRYQKANETFTFFPLRGGNETLSFRVNITEGLSDGTDSSWSSGWQKTFDINAKRSETSDRDQMLWAIPLFLVAFAFVAILGSRRE